MWALDSTSQRWCSKVHNCSPPSVVVYCDFFFFSSRRRHTRSVSAFLLNRSSDLQQLNGLETLVIIMVANKYAFLQITRRRFLNEWEAFKKVISRRNIRRRITIPLTLSNLKLLRRIT